MHDVDRTTRFSFKPHFWLINFVGLIVPRRLRSDWRQEWEAELQHREALLADGLLAALASARLMQSLLFKVEATDPLTFVVIPLMLAGRCWLVTCRRGAR